MAYINYSMSERAAIAYSEDKMPKSKWTKTKIIDVCKQENIRPEIVSVLAKTPAPLVKNLLTYSEWHHTSNWYNQTDFYKVDLEYLEDVSIDDLKAFLERCNKPKATNEYKARCRYLEWSGTRKHPKATECESIGTIKGNWFYLSNGSKKSVNAKGFVIIEKL